MFTKLTEELMSEGFLADLMESIEKQPENAVKIPQDHKKPQKKEVSQS